MDASFMDFCSEGCCEFTIMDFPYTKGQQGLFQDIPDSRDLPLGSVPSAPVQLPAVYQVPETINIKVEDQGSSSSCVGQSFAKYAEVLEAVEKKRWFDLSAKWIYSRIALTGGGAYLRDGAKAVCNVGVAPEFIDPSYPANEAYMTQKNLDPVAVNSALVYRAKAYASVPNNLNDIKKAIMTWHGSVSGSNISSGGWSGQAVQASGGFVRPPVSGEEINGHAFFLCGWDDNKQAIKFLNSWSQQWGVGGFAWFKYSDIAWLFSGWTLVDMPDEVINDIKNMYDLVRNPNKPSEIYAKTGTTIRHIANWQTLVLGDKTPDRFWMMPDSVDAIRIANPVEWATFVETSEIHLDPKD